MSWVAIVSGVCMAAAGWGFRREGPSPRVILVLSVGLTCVAFFLNQSVQVAPSWMSHFWYVARDYRPQGVFVSGTYAALAGVAWLIGGSSKRTRRAEEASSLGLPRLGSTRWSSVLGLGSVLLMWLLFMYHITEVDFRQLWSYQTYLSARDPDQVGISSIVGQLTHSAAPAIGVLLAAYTALLMSRSEWIKGLFVSVPAAYACLLSLAFVSRFAVAQVVVFGFVFQVRRGRRISKTFLMSGMVAVLLMLVIIGQRRSFGPSRSAGQLGLAHVTEAPFRVEVKGFENFLLLNFFNGGPVLAEAVQRRGVEFPPEYQVRAVSPLPSVVDSFDEYRDLAPKAAPTAPFGALVEVGAFNRWIAIPFVLAWLLGFRVMSSFWWRWSSPLAVVALVPAYYSIMRMHTYPIRNTWRWYLVSVFLCLVLGRYLSRRSLTREASQENDLANPVSLAG